MIINESASTAYSKYKFIFIILLHILNVPYAHDLTYFKTLRLNYRSVRTLNFNFRKK